MEIRELCLPDVYLVTPTTHADVRGVFYEAFKRDELGAATGHPLHIAQTNCSVSRRGTIRGIHGARIAPSQAKLVSCLRGAVLDMVVDLRVGSPTFGKHVVNWLDARSAAAVYMAEGFGHAFLALDDDSCVYYQCSAVYIPEIVFDLDPLDPELALPWGLTGPAIMSDKDRRAPSLAQALEGGLLSSYEDCVAFYEKQRSAGAGS
jgi:NDP-hexose 3,5-(Or5-) epimerase